MGLEPANNVYIYIDKNKTGNIKTETQQDKIQYSTPKYELKSNSSQPFFLKNDSTKWELTTPEDLAGNVIKTRGPQINVWCIASQKKDRNV